LLWKNEHEDAYHCRLGSADTDEGAERQIKNQKLKASKRRKRRKRTRTIMLNWTRHRDIVETFRTRLRANELNPTI